MNWKIADPEKFISRVGLLIFILVLLAGYGLNQLLERPEIRIDSDAIMTVTVRPGDTIWSIAEQTAQTNGDLRFDVLDIIRLNQLDGNGTIQVGQKIMLPLHYDGNQLADSH
ncbi:MAG: LysM peptidoglycan-binding domain-containing protein [Tissierellia bacterium]|jgi:nucleoid-associated protein YgaU|nr:LysM peptidoglycan-binding domain-containing protein [Tissierellia bacterium]